MKAERLQDWLRALGRLPGDGVMARRHDRPTAPAPAGDGAATGPSSPYAFAYEACDIPAGMTIREFRAFRAAANAGEAGMASLERVCAAVRACLGRAGAVA
jgi:hypothetical protein